MQFKERKYERFNYNAPMIFKHKKQKIWSWGYSVDISLGGLLIKTEDLISAGQILDLHITNLETGLLFSMSATVVRVIESSPKGPAIAIEFISPGSSHELLNLLDFIKTYIIPISDGPPVTPWEKENAIKMAKELMDRAQFMNYYQTLDLHSEAMPDEVKERRNFFMKKLNIPVNGLNEREIKTLKNAINLMERISGVLSNPQRRLAYDIATGNVSPRAVNKLRKQYGLDLQEFRKYWVEKYPQKVKQAANQQITDDKTLNKALKMDPFNENLLDKIGI